VNAIEIKDIRFAYKNGPSILEGCDLTAKAGERLFLFGPSGSGKTTLLSLITGILRPDSGTVHVLGEDMHALASSERDELRGSRMGYIFQMFNLLPYLTALENILLPCRMNPLRAARVAEPVKEAEHLMEKLGISALRDVQPFRMSVGQQQRVAAARALLGAPDLIIADEPTSALDTDYRERFLELLFENTRKSSAAILFVSHDRSLASLFDRQISLPDINRAFAPAAGDRSDSLTRRPARARGNSPRLRSKGKSR
jgi:putative ABC transport system ATP-binding protein